MLEVAADELQLVPNGLAEVNHNSGAWDSRAWDLEVLMRQVADVVMSEVGEQQQMAIMRIQNPVVVMLTVCDSLLARDVAPSFPHEHVAQDADRRGAGYAVARLRICVAARRSNRSKMHRH